MIKIIPIKTRSLKLPKDDLLTVFNELSETIEDGDILCITSKVLSIHQGRCLKIADVADRDKLILSEADSYVPRADIPNGLALPTITNHTLINAAGIDTNSALGYYILWPKDISKLLQEIHTFLKQKFGIKNLGIVATDSRSQPLRYGTTGIAIGFFGFHPLYDHKNPKENGGPAKHFTNSNLPDTFAAAGVMSMSEGAENTPLAIIRGFPRIHFANEDLTKEWQSKEDDIYKSLLSEFKNI